MPKTAAKAKQPAPGAKTPNSTKTDSSLPAVTISALPSAAEIIRYVQAIEALLPKVEKELGVAEKAGVIALARAFVVFHRLNERMLSNEMAFKPYRALYNNFKMLRFPQALEQSGMENVPLSEGWRVGVSMSWRASIKEGKKAEAYAWLQGSDHGDVVQETVNASTLSALAKELHENQNIDLPPDIFNAAQVPNTTVNKI